jgi:lactate dehydrogenase-like 2-hydroxyacid dehydrogenase
MAAVLHFEVKIVALSRVMRKEPEFLFLPPWYPRPVDQSGDGSSSSSSVGGGGGGSSEGGPAPFRTELKGKTVGIIGLGGIGKQVRHAALCVRPMIPLC